MLVGGEEEGSEWEGRWEQKLLAPLSSEKGALALFLRGKGGKYRSPR